MHIFNFALCCATSFYTEHYHSMHHVWPTFMDKGCWDLQAIVIECFLLLRWFSHVDELQREHQDGNSRFRINRVLELCYGSTTVSHMLSGKAVSHALQGLLMVDAAMQAVMLQTIAATNDNSVVASDAQKMTEVYEHLLAGCDWDVLTAVALCQVSAGCKGLSASSKMRYLKTHIWLSFGCSSCTMLKPFACSSKLSTLVTGHCMSMLQQGSWICLPPVVTLTMPNRLGCTCKWSKNWPTHILGCMISLQTMGCNPFTCIHVGPWFHDVSANDMGAHNASVYKCASCNDNFNWPPKHNH